MKVLVPIDDSGPSERALRFAADLSERFGGSLHAVHVSDAETEATERVLERAREILVEEGVGEDPEVSVDVDADLGLRTADEIGEAILDLVEEGEYDHVVMGHHGRGMVDRVMLGSATETVVRADAVPVTIVP